MWPGPECYFTMRPVAHDERQVTAEYEPVNTNPYPMLEIHVHPHVMLGLVAVVGQTLVKVTTRLHIALVVMIWKAK